MEAPGPFEAPLRKTPRADLLQSRCQPDRLAVAGAACQARNGRQGTGQIAEGVQAAYAKGELPRMEAVAFAYMFSADQDLGPGLELARGILT
jgi:hypothetical protein